jgi:hypothetical protein
VTPERAEFKALFASLRRANEINASLSTALSRSRARVYRLEVCLAQTAIAKAESEREVDSFKDQLRDFAQDANRLQAERDAARALAGKFQDDERTLSEFLSRSL